MSCWFPQVIWLALCFQNIFQTPRIVQIITASGRHRASEGLNRRRVSGFGLFVPAVLFTAACAIVYSAWHKRPQTAKARRAAGALSPLALICRLCVSTPGEWLTTTLRLKLIAWGYNNEKLLAFRQWEWRSVKSRDTAVTETTWFYINVLSNSPILKTRVAFDPRDCVLLIGLYRSIFALFMTAQSWWMSVCCAEWKSRVTSQMLLHVHPGCLGDACAPASAQPRNNDT